MSALFTPLRLAGLELPNRIVVSPMCQYSALDGSAQPWHHFHAGMLAFSGAGLLILEATAVEARGRITPECLGLYSDANESALHTLVDGIRRYEGRSRIGIQLSHAGRKASTRKTWELKKGRFVPPEEGGWAIAGPTGDPYAPDWLRPHGLDLKDLKDLRHAFVQSTQRAHRAGIELVEVQCAHGYLLHSFLSPLTNTRADAYGGSEAARLRFPLEVMRAVRDAWPADKPLGARITGSDWIPGGLTLDDAAVFASALREMGVDYVVVSGGNIAPGVSYPKVEPAYMADMAREVRRQTGAVTMAVGMIADPRLAEQIVAEGSADLVAIGRAFLDDPHWAWHAAAVLDQPIARPPQYARVQPDMWPGYHLVHGVGPDLAAGAMGHASRD